MELNLLNSDKKVIISNVDSDLSKYKWYLSPDSYARATIEGIRYFLHRYIMKPNKDLEIDHINGNRLDNQRSNLRICSHRENVINSKPQKNKIYSKYKGVTYCSTEKRIKRWKACCEVNNKNVYAGRFHTEEEAALSYNQKAKELFGKFARLNEVAQ